MKDSRLICAVVLCVAAAAALADSWTSTRSTAYDWACTDAAGAVLSQHQRQDKAFEACGNRALADGGTYYVKAGSYKVTATISQPQPPPVTSTGTATVSWAAPTMNTDGTPLTDLAGYRLYTGTSPGALNTMIQLPDPSVLTYDFKSLAPGTHYFAGTAYTTAGKESALSNVLSKVIQ